MAKTSEIRIQSRSHSDMVCIDRKVNDAIKQLGIQTGVIHLNVLHTTCGLTINENADPDVVHDLLLRLDEQVKWHHPKDRHGEGNSAAHLKSSMMGVHLVIPVKNSQLVLGTWQGIYLCEFDGPRTRTIHITAID